MAQTKGIQAIVCPKQKLVKILIPDGNKHKLGKVFRFKEDVPKVKKTITVNHYDAGEWGVSDRDWTSEEVVTVYDETAIESIRARAIEFYKNSLNIADL